MKVIISGGGTGGHIYPAIAIANRLKARLNDVEILFIGALGKMEMEKVPQAGYEIVGLPVTGIQRRLTAENLKVPFRVLKSMRVAKRTIKEFAPDVVVGVGGYASGPALWVASGMKIPTVLQEQNSYAGLTNKILAKRVDVICVAYPGMERFFPEDRIRFTGNPVRDDLKDLDGKKEQAIEKFGLHPDKKTLFLFGGSLGARTLNEAVASSSDLLKEQSDIQVLWQMGKLYAERFGASESAALPNVHAVQFVDRMDLAFAAADVVICRAGASTVSELCLVAKPAVLVPSPNVAEDHQTKNAMVLVDREAAELVHEEHAGSSALPLAIRLLSDPDRCDTLSENISKLARPDASDEIVDEIIKASKR